MGRKSFWTSKRENTLKGMIKNGQNLNEICNHFKKSERSIRSKLIHLNVDLPPSQDNKKEKITCLNCDDQFISSLSENRKFCSSTCSALYLNRTQDRSHSDETKEKISKSISEWHKNNDYNFSNNDWQTGVKAHVKKSMERLMNEPFEELSWERKRKRILIEQKNTCDECGIDEWQGKSLSLEIDHVDGVKKNNKRENLRGLCPNCHSQTDTFRGRNKNARKHVSDEVLIESLKNSKSIRQALINVGMAGKGANYKRVKKLMLAEEIEKL